MSQQYDNELRGVLFKNDRKEQPNHPDYKGSATINGQEMWISAWIKEGQRGKFMSLSFKPKDQQQPRQQKQAGPAPSADFEDFNSDIPFASASHDITGNRLQRRLNRGRV
jgi:hypothetical protein